MTELTDLPPALQEEAVITRLGFEGELPPPEEQDREFFENVVNDTEELAAEPFSDIPVLPDGLETLTEAWMNRWAEWIAAGRPEIPADAKLIEPRLFAELDFNPAAHPRDPDTGKFVERPFDIPSDAPNFSDMSTKETLSYIDENGGDVAGTVFDPGTPVTVDGVPNDATSLDDIDDGGGSPTRDLANRAAEIRDSDAAGFKRRDEIESLIEEETGVTARFGDFTPEQAAAAAAGVSAVVEREGSLPDHLEKFRAGISADVTDDLDAKPLGIHRMINDAGVIELDPEQFDDETMERLNDDGFLVGDSARDAMIHELGHAVHRERAFNGSGDGYFGRSMPMDASTKESIRDNISDYAAENVKEFVAEGYTARIVGVDIEDDDVNIAGLLDHFLGED